MTTILGLQTTVGKDAVVLATDRQMSMFIPDAYANKQAVEEMDFKKIYIGKNFAFTMAGAAIQSLMEFWKNLQVKDPKDPKFVDLEHILVDGGVFDEVRQMNLEAAAGNVEEVRASAQVRFIFATNYNKTPKIHYVFPLGGVEEFDAFSVEGTGKEFIMDDLQDAYKGDTLDGPRVTLPQAIKLADRCISNSRSDPYSGGTMPDIAVITGDSISYYGDELLSRYKKFRKSEIQRIIDAHK